jgi:hypothetical protein
MALCVYFKVTASRLPSQRRGIVIQGVYSYCIPGEDGEYPLKLEHPVGCLAGT